MATQPSLPPDAATGMYCSMCSQSYGEGLAFCPKDGTRLTIGAPPSASITGIKTSPLVGTILADRYRIIRKIGEGGMGEVFEAHHVYIDKKFAIKTLRAEITTNAEAVARFHQEARSASTIGQENIVEIDDFGQLEGGGVYLAMEFLDGVSLGDRMKATPSLPRAEALDYLMQVCRGLAAAHDKGIIHRDMKPENIFLARSKSSSPGAGKKIVKILDFGIAKVIADGSDQRLTQTGAVFGTPFYMSPEQALGRAPDRRSDIYSMGVILYEVFSGRVPFQGESFMGILSQHITSLPTPPSQLGNGSDVPPSLERVILKAMAKEPEGRQQSMLELHAELEAVARDAGAATLGNVGVLALAKPVVRGASASRNVAVESSAEVVVAPRRGNRRGLMPAMLAGALLLGALVVLGVLAAGRKKTPQNDAPPTTAVLAKDAPPPQIAPVKNVPAEPAQGEVLLDTNPPGARVYAGEKVLGDTPALIAVAAGTTLEVSLVRDGYATKSVTLDPAQKSRLVVPLERTHHGSKVPLAQLPRPPEIPPPPPSPSMEPPPPIQQPVQQTERTRVAPPSRIQDPGYTTLTPLPVRKKPNARTRAPVANAPLDPY